MLRSMTGFSRAVASNDNYESTVEIRSLNHRYLDTNVKMIPKLPRYEGKVRESVGASLQRGKIDVTVFVSPKNSSAYELSVDRHLLRGVAEQARKLQDELKLSASLTLSELIALSNGFRIQERDFSEDRGLLDLLENALGKALISINKMRSLEGAVMEDDVNGRLVTLRAQLDEIELISEENLSSHREEMMKKVSELVTTFIDPKNVAMDVARLVERGNVSEEITRFRSHLKLWGKSVSGSEPCGKKLDYIAQEMNREVNTIGAKSQNSKIAEHVIIMKAQLERIREQVQNVL